MADKEFEDMKGFLSYDGEEAGKVTVEHVTRALQFWSAQGGKSPGEINEILPVDDRPLLIAIGQTGANHASDPDSQLGMEGGLDWLQRVLKDDVSEDLGAREAQEDLSEWIVSLGAPPLRLGGQEEKEQISKDDLHVTLLKAEAQKYMK